MHSHLAVPLNINFFTELHKCYRSLASREFDFEVVQSKGIGELLAPRGVNVFFRVCNL